MIAKDIQIITTYPPEVVEIRNRLNQLLACIDADTMRDLKGPLDAAAFQRRIDRRNNEAQPILDELARLEATNTGRRVIVTLPPK